MEAICICSREEPEWYGVIWNADLHSDLEVLVEGLTHIQDLISPYLLMFSIHSLSVFRLEACPQVDII